MGAAVDLEFEGGSRVRGTALEGDDESDLALLDLTGALPDAFAPIVWTDADDAMEGERFKAEGFGVDRPPGSAPHTIDGHLVSLTRIFDEAPALQLNSNQLIAGENIHQFSGGPVLVQVGRDRETPLWAAVGVVRWQKERPDDPGRAVGGDFYATPVSRASALWPAVAPELSSRRAFHIDRRPQAPEWRTQVQGLLAISLQEDGTLPFVDAVSMYSLGVSRSKYAEGEAAPYVGRTVDERLDELIATESCILIAGSSKSGKSRTAIELVRRNCPGARLIVPTEDAAAPTRLASFGVPAEAERAILWLDDLERYLGLGALDLKVLDYFSRRQPRVTVLATIRSQRLDGLLRSDDDATRAARVVLDRFEAGRLTLPRLLNDTEQTTATGMYPREDFAGRGIGEQLVAAPLLERQYDAAFETEPHGWALVQAAIDWRRTGLQEGLTRELLRGFGARYLLESRPDMEPSDGDWEAGLKWATEPVAGKIALLVVTVADGERVYRAFDYIVAYADGQNAVGPNEIAPFAWELAITHASPRELLSLGKEAYARERYEVARLALVTLRGSEAGSDRDRGWATVLLGAIESDTGNLDAATEYLEETLASKQADVLPAAQLQRALVAGSVGDYSRAEELYAAAASSGDPNVVATAQASLGGILLNRGAPGDLERAEVVLQSAIEAGDPEAASIAKANLGAVLMNQGKLERAQELLHAAIDSGAPEAASIARANLGAILLNQGELERAQETLQSAIDSTENQHSLTSRMARHMAEASLGGLLAIQGELDRAAALLQAVIDSGSTQAVPMARGNLATVMIQRGELERANELLQAAIDSGNPQAVPMAETNLGAILMIQGELERARALLQSAIATGRPPAAPIAEAHLGVLLVASGEVDRGEELLASAIDSGNPLAVLIAQLALAGLARVRGELERAEELLQIVIDSGNAQTTPLAEANLGAVLMIRGELDRAQELLQAAIDSGNPYAVPMAMANLGAILLNRGELDRAQELLQAAIDSGDPQAMPMAEANLGAMLMNQGELDRAQELLQAAIDSGNPQATPMSMANLGAILMNRGELERGEELLQAAIDSGNPQAAPMAQANLGAILMNQGNLDRAQELFQAAIDSGDPQATAMSQANLGVILMNRGERDRAQELLQAAIDSGIRMARTPAGTALGYLLMESDPDAARRCWEQAAAAGSTRAMLGLAALVEDSDPDAARGWCERAGAAGDPDAMVALGAMLQDSDPEAARLWWAQAAGRGRADALLNLAQLLASRDAAAEARAVLEAASAEHGEIAPLATLYREMLESEEWDANRAAAALLRAAQTRQDGDVAQRAATVLAVLGRDAD